ncbi:alpha/beta fold hydrolase [Kitasatospora sp. NPDC058115]|uniref:alpha/beta fold hydrolase n=1 Tax=Kitasatospora sp. NPDC058115 TaxID=3346347 RepID=UPI0036D75DD1
MTGAATGTATGAVTPRLPVVLLHALPLSSAMWQAQATALRERGHTVIVPDQRGFGAEPLGEQPPSLDTVADDLAARLDALGHRKVTLVGCSMGGYAAMAFLRRHRRRVGALALLATRATADTPEQAAGRRAFAGLVVDDAQRDELITRTTPLLLGATTKAERPGTLAEVLAWSRAADPRAVAWAQEAVATRPDSVEVLRATDVPALVAIGTEDELVSVDEATLTAGSLPQGRLVTVPGAGHLQPLEAPELTTRLLTTLLDGDGTR